MRAGLIAAALVGALYACSGESVDGTPSFGGSTGVAAGSSSTGAPAGDSGGGVGGDGGSTGGSAVGGSPAGGASGEGAGAAGGGLGGVGELGGAGGEPPACEPIEVVECGPSWPERCGTVNDGCEDVECGDTCESDAYCSSAGVCEPFADPEECQGTEDGSHTVCVDYKGDPWGYERRWCTISPQVDSGCVWDPAVACLRCGEPCDPNPCADDPTRYCNSDDNYCFGYWPGPVSEIPTADKTVCIDAPKYKDDNSGEIEYARFYTADPPNEEAGCTWDTGEACWKCGGAP